MDLLVRTIRTQGVRAVGSRESLPHWGWGARAALGVLSLIALFWPFVTLVAMAVTSGPTADSILTGSAYAMLVYHTLLVFVFGSFVTQNPRIYGLRTVWLLGLLVAAPAIIPLYWWVHVWNAPYIGDYEQDELPTPRRA